MANTYKKVYLHIVFAVKNREALLDKSWRSELFSYMSGILKKRGHYPLAVNGHKDHVHLLFDYSLKELPAELVRELKKASNQLINEHYVSNNLFNWQSGYGIFSVSAVVAFAMVYFSGALEGSGMAALVLIWLPAIVAVGSIILYFLLRFATEKYAWIITILAVLFNLFFGISAFFQS